MMKKFLTFFMCIGLVVVLTACGTENKWIFSLNEEKIYDREVTLFGLIYTKEYNVDMEQLAKEREDGQTYADFYKNGLENEIISVVLLYKEAQNAKYKLTKEEIKDVEAESEAFVSFYGKDWLKKKDISVSDVKTVYEMRALGNSYAKSLSTDEAVEKQPEEERYVKVYQVTFPTVLPDKNGMVQSDKNGRVMKQSEEKCQEIEEAAHHYADQAHAGEDMKTLLDDYDESVTGMEKYLKYADLNKEYKDAIDQLEENGVSDVIVSDYGYYVVQLLDGDASDHAKLLASYEENSGEQQEKGELLDKLYATYVREDQNYKNQELWENVKISYFIK